MEIIRARSAAVRGDVHGGGVGRSRPDGRGTVTVSTVDEL